MPEAVAIIGAAREQPDGDSYLTLGIPVLPGVGKANFEMTKQVMNKQTPSSIDKSASGSRILARTGQRRNGGILPLLVGAIIAFGALASVIYWSFLGGTENDSASLTLMPVTRGEFVAKVLDQGEVQSAENIELKCQVGSRNGNISVIDVIPEGTYVKEGDWLVTLDATSFEKEREQQLLAVSNAETEVISAKAAWDTALASKDEYTKGTFLEEERTIINELFNAEQELEQAKAYLAHSVNLQKKGFLTKQQLKSDEIAVEKAFNSVALEKQRLIVLRDITYAKEMILLDSEIAAADVKHKNAIEAKNIEDRQMAEILRQLEFCRIVVPKGVEGEVVYHKEFDRRGGSEWVLEPGASVREQQVLVKLPNPNLMEVKVLINEQSITAIQQNMPATISVDALASKPLTGFVTKVNSYAEQSGGMGPSTVREYAIFVKILNPPKQLIPGMNASVSIQTEYQPSVLQTPLQCIYSANNTAFVYKATGPNTFETVEIKIVSENTQNVWIESGVEEGDQLVMDPGQVQSFLEDLPETEKESRIELPEGTGVVPPENTTTNNGATDKGTMEKSTTENAAPAGNADQTAKADRPRGDRQRGAGGERGGDGERGGPAGGGGGFNMDAMIDRTMERYDTNTDGKIDSEEQKSFDERASRFSDADKDADGNITREEIKSAMDAMMRQFQQNGGAGAGTGGN